MKAIYSSINELSIMLPVAEKLYAEHGVKPVYWSGLQKDKQVLCNAFPGLLFHDFFGAIKGEWPEQLSLQDSYKQFSDELLSEYSEIEKTFYELCMTRSDPGGGFKFYELTNYYHRALAGALAIVEQCQPDVWISTSPPHSMYDNVMYEVCKKNGIKIIILFDTNVPGYLFVANQIRHDVKPLEKEAQRLLKEKIDISEEKLPAAVLKYITGIRQTYDEGKPFHFEINYPGDSGLSRHSFNRIDTELKAKRMGQLKALAKKYLSLNISRKMAKHQYLKQAGKRWKESYLDELSWMKCRIQTAQNIRTTFDDYQSLSVPFEPQKSYVYFPLHMQPECTTVPQGGRYADQLLALRMLRSVLPEDEYIYVKETPGQFRWHRGASARYDWIYQEIADMPNVCLLPTDTDPFALVDNSLCVFCITGTSGWESLIRGKPVISMGELYFYKGFHGVYQVSSSQQIAEALTEIGKQPKLDWQVTLRYLHALINISSLCTPQEKYMKLHGISFDKNVNNLVKVIEQQI